MQTITLYTNTLPILFKELNVNELKLILILMWFMSTNNTDTFINSSATRELLSSNGFNRSTSRLETLLNSLVNKGILTKIDNNNYQFATSKIVLPIK